MNEVLFRTIDNLPPLPATVVKLRDYIDSVGADVDITKVAAIIQEDPLLTAELLRLANSPFYGLSREVSTIQQVVSLLGVSNVKNITIANSIKNVFRIDVSPYGIDTGEFMNTCAREANFVADWLGEEDKKLSQMLVPCAMLLRLGVILFSNSLRVLGKDEEFLQKLKKQNFTNISLVEEECCGVDSLSFLGFLFNHWRFDESLIEYISFMTNPHSAHDDAKKGAYALAVINCLFESHVGGSSTNIHKAFGLLEEAQKQGVYFSIENFKNKIPADLMANFEQTSVEQTDN